jgi:MazG nucleotide pyrophosphohydrolase domain
MSSPSDFLLNDYQAAAKATALYPFPVPGVPVYPLIGFAGEVGELMEALVGRPVDQDAVLKESGDVLWYLAAIATDIGFQLGDVYTDFGDVRRTVEHLRDSFIWTPSAALTIFVGKIAEDVKKSIRDSGSVVDEKRLVRIRSSIADSLMALDAILSEYALTLGEAAYANLAKLAARKSAGTIQGSGDTR